MRVGRREAGRPGTGRGAGGDSRQEGVGWFEFLTAPATRSPCPAFPLPLDPGCTIRVAEAVGEVVVRLAHGPAAGRVVTLYRGAIRMSVVIPTPSGVQLKNALGRTKSINRAELV